MPSDRPTAPPGAPPDDSGWRLRAVRDGDEAAILAGFERVYGRRMSPATWRWKLRARPALTDTSWVAVDRDQRPIFHYAGIPCRLRLPAGDFDIL
ncbi:MAG: hypothetical protein AAF560_33405, partial [Acidobacteriota bacterium]